MATRFSIQRELREGYLRARLVNSTFSGGDQSDWGQV